MLENSITDLINRATARADRDVGAWQRQIESRFSLELNTDSNRFSLYDGTQKTASFVWANIVEIQRLRCEGFPPRMWNMVTESGSWLVPDGGRYAEALTDRIYALPDYHTQQVVKLPPPPGYASASSMWRKNDRYPKHDPSDFDDIWRARLGSVAGCQDPAYPCRLGQTCMPRAITI